MSDWADKSTDDLGARIVSGVLLIVLGLSAAFAGGPWLAAAAAAAATAMSFEYARMSERPALTSAFLLCWASSVTAVMAASLGLFWLALGLLLAGAAASAARRRGWLKRGEAAFGVLYVGAPCAALVWLRNGPDGLAIVLALFAMIWSADVMAYVGGRFVGGPKIRPSLSPNKTWAGLIFGTLAGAAAGGVYSQAVSGAPLELALVGAGVAAIGLGGDLFESSLKRRFGVKDASNLIPGHGGVLDRLDGLMAATLAVAAAVTLFPSAPSMLLGARA